MLERAWENLVGRLDGPMHFRILLQPLMATIFAAFSGIRSARRGVKPSLWKAFTDSGHRWEYLRDGWRSVGRVFLLAVVIDLAYQIHVFGRVYPGEVLIVAFFLSMVPYLLLRGPFYLLAVLWGVKPKPASEAGSSPPVPPTEPPTRIRA